MNANWAFRIHGYGGPENVRRDDIAAPDLGAGQVMVEVAAAGVNPVDRRWRTGFFSSFAPLDLPAQLGAELSGTVTAVAADVSRLSVGDRVMGLAPMRSFSKMAAVDEKGLCRTPGELNDIEAAALPVAALMAWQMLQLGKLRAGGRVLVHGAAGAIGGFAVQMAKQAGASVIATASASSTAHVASNGADMIIDYMSQSFEHEAGEVDLVIDLVGGPVFERSLGLLRADGIIVSAVELAAAPKAEAVGKRGIFHRLLPDAARLEALAQDVARGRLRSTIAEVVEADELPDAIERAGTGHAPGKIVVSFVPQG